MLWVFKRIISMHTKQKFLLMDKQIFTILRSKCLFELDDQLEPHYREVGLYKDADFVCLFDLILYVSSTIFQLNGDRSSWVEPVLC